jgi:hypothetical protein
MQKDIAVIHTVPPLHPDPQDLSFTQHTRATDGEMAFGSLIAEPIPSSVAVRLTGRFELNGDKSRNGLRWPLYAPRITRRSLPAVGWRGCLTVSAGYWWPTSKPPLSRRSLSASVARPLELRCCGLTLARLPRTRYHRQTESRPVSFPSSLTVTRLVVPSGECAETIAIRAVAALQPAQTTRRERLRGARSAADRKDRHRFSFRYGLGTVRLMFTTHRSGMPSTDDERHSRAMLYVAHGICPCRSSR